MERANNVWPCQTKMKDPVETLYQLKAVYDIFLWDAKTFIIMTSKG